MEIAIVIILSVLAFVIGLKMHSVNEGRPQR
jgi:hypothetical protein